MDRFEVKVTNQVTGDSYPFTEHASSPRVALQRVLQYRMEFPKTLASDRMLSLKFDISNQGKVKRIVEVEWDDAIAWQAHIDGIQYATHDEDGVCQVERKRYRYSYHYIPTKDPLPEGWEVYRQGREYEHRLKPGADATALMAAVQDRLCTRF